MADINFYHLSKSPLEKALVNILEKILEMGKKALVVADTPERVAGLNSTLWTYSPGSFLPHGTLEDGYVELQPILITSDFTNSNQAHFLISVDGRQISDFANYEKCMDMFNGLDETSVTKARQRWQDYKAQGHNLTYWFQSEQGAWQKKE